jgi:putative transposase
MSSIGGRTYRRLKLKLKKKDRKNLKEMTTKGRDSARVLNRARILQLLHEDHTTGEISKILKVSPETVRRIGWKYIEGGLQNALYESPRPGQETVLNSKQANRIVAMVCSDPPSGRARWTVRLLTEEAIKKRIVLQVSRETIRRMLKNHDLKPWLEKNVVHT